MKAVIPAAGLGTRMLPATKSMPKEMLPVVDTPVIQCVVEEAVASGCDEVLIITGRGKRAVEDHFDHSFELEHHLREAGRDEALRIVEAVSDLADIHYVRQKEPLGLGHAVLCARRYVGDEPFAVLLGDDMFDAPIPCTRQLLAVHEETSGSAFAAMEVPLESISRYGAVDGEPVRDDLLRVRNIVEKPAPVDAPSNLATVGRYVFTPDIFDELARMQPGHGGEIQLTDAMSALCRRRDMHSLRVAGRRLDVGTLEGFLEANLYMALRRTDLDGRGLVERLLRELDALGVTP